MKGKAKILDIQLSMKNDKLIQEAAMKSRLKPEEVLSCILNCEVKIAFYAMSERLKLFRKLKIEPTIERLLGIKVK